MLGGLAAWLPPRVAIQLPHWDLAVALCDAMALLSALEAGGRMCLGWGGFASLSLSLRLASSPLFYGMVQVPGLINFHLFGQETPFIETSRCSMNHTGIVQVVMQPILETVYEDVLRLVQMASQVLKLLCIFGYCTTPLFYGFDVIPSFPLCQVIFKTMSQCGHETIKALKLGSIAVI